MANYAAPPIQTNKRNGMIGKMISNPALLLFVSTNVVNAGNLLFNILLSRWMGPQLYGDLAILVTVKLSILSILNAVQFEVASRVARLPAKQDQLVHGHCINQLNLKLLAVGGIAFLSLVAAWYFLHQEDSNLATAYLVFAISLPFMTPLSLVRGWSQGALDLSRIIWSAQAEMMVRLVGSAIAWHLGAGLLGIALAIALSIIIGWYCAKPGLHRKTAGQRVRPSRQNHDPAVAFGEQFHLHKLLLASLPWAALQLGQVLALDGDFLVAKVFLDSHQGGLTAVTALVQRTLFFGCFGLAVAVLPAAAMVGSKKQMRDALKPVVMLFVATALPSLAMLFAFPDILINLVFGSQFIGAAQSLGYAGISGSCFVGIYILATFFLARSRTRMGYVVFFFSILISIALAMIALFWPQADMHSLIIAKAILLSISFIFMLGLAGNEYKQYK